MNKISQESISRTSFIPAVVGYPVRNNQVLLGLRKKTSLGLGLNLISGIGGKVADEPNFANETPEEALVREFTEEVSIKIEEFKYYGNVRFIFPQRPKWNHSVSIYIIESWQGQPQETEPTKPQWFEISNLPWCNMWHDNHLWLPQVLSGHQIDRVYLYDSANTKVVRSLINQ